MRRHVAPTHAATSRHAADNASSLLLVIMLLACLVPLLTALSSAHGQEQPAAAAATPASVPRGWIEPAAPAEAASPATSAPNRPATLRLPDEQPRPLPGRRLPDLPPAAEFDAAVVASFTSGIQPLLLNRCAAGKCHGGSEAALPQLHRQSFRGTINRELTLHNIQAVTSAVLPDFDTRRLLGPASQPHGGGSQPPLTAAQLQRLAIWINAALAQRARWARVEQASFQQVPPATSSPTPQPTTATPPPDNRFQRMLDDAANPQPLPPPQQPTGLIPLEDLPEAQPEANENRFE